MNATWQIDGDPATLLIRMVLKGFFQVDDVRRFDADRRAAIRSLNCGLNRHLMLCNVSQTALSTPDVVEALKLAINNPLLKARRCAMVVPGALAKMQARRTVLGGDMRMFDTTEAAEHWLLAADSAARVTG